MTGRTVPAAVWLMAALCGTGIAAEPGNPAAAELRAPPNALWDIVSTCIDRDGGAPKTHYCECEAFARSCCYERATPNAVVVWAETSEFVAIRDLKMCGCATGFVAGLALPRTLVTGIEDPARPEGIWPFAWAVARDRISEELEIGLVINSIEARSQNQMHVHMLRLKPGARDVLEAGRVSGRMAEPPGTIVLHLA